jgi:hypothetical protein
LAEDPRQMVLKLLIIVALVAVGTLGLGHANAQAECDMPCCDDTSPEVGQPNDSMFATSGSCCDDQDDSNGPSPLLDNEPPPADASYPQASCLCAPTSESGSIQCVQPRYDFGPTTDSPQTLLITPQPATPRRDCGANPSLSFTDWCCLRL